MNKNEDTEGSVAPEQGERLGPAPDAAESADGFAYLSPDELRRIAADIPARLPGEDCMETRVALVDVDPCHAHVYWHVEAGDLERVEPGPARGPGAVRLLLVVHDALCVGMHGFVPWAPIEVALTKLEGYHQVEVPDCGKDLVAELVALGSGGGRATLAWSRPVRLPRGGGSPQAPERVELVLVREIGGRPRALDAPPQACLEFLHPEPCGLPGAPRRAASPAIGCPPSYVGGSWFWSAQVASGRTGGGHD